MHFACKHKKKAHKVLLKWNYEIRWFYGFSFSEKSHTNLILDLWLGDIFSIATSCTCLCQVSYLPLDLIRLMWFFSCASFWWSNFITYCYLFTLYFGGGFFVKHGSYNKICTSLFIPKLHNVYFAGAVPEKIHD